MLFVVRLQADAATDEVYARLALVADAEVSAPASIQYLTVSRPHFHLGIWAVLCQSLPPPFHMHLFRRIVEVDISNTVSDSEMLEPETSLLNYFSPSFASGC